MVFAIILNDKFSSGIIMSKPVHDVSEGATVTFPNTTGTQRGRPKAASISASCGDRQNAVPVGSTDDVLTSGKRISAYPVQRRGSRKKTLSLNPEEREALENLIEEVIMGGVGEGVIDSDASSSDDDADAELPSSAQHSVSGLSATVAAGDLAIQDTSVKSGKKFYPGQLKVALKHMHDLPPRFVRKLAKAQQYLDSGGSMYSKPVVSVGRIDEEDEMTAHSKDDIKQPKLASVAVTPGASVLERDRDKTKVKEHKLKDAKKVIRTLLTDRDQYIDETVSTAVVSSHSYAASSDSAYSTMVTIASDQKSPNVVQYHQRDTAAQPVVSDSVLVGESTASASAGSLASVVTCTSDAQVYHPSIGVSSSSRTAEYIQQTSDVHYRAGQTSNLSPSGSQPVPVSQFQPPSVGIPQYQLSVPVVHGMKPAPVLSQSPPGTQYWIPQAVVPSSSPGFYGSSPPVVGMPGVPGAYSQFVPYAYSIQSSYPAVQGVHAPYSPQYLYSASPPNQGLVGPPYSATTFSQPVSYPLTVLPPEQYVRPPRAVPTNFYQNTPPPGYCPTQSCHVSDQRPMFASDVPPPADGTRKHMVSADYTHNLSALSVQVLASHQSPAQPVYCNTDARSGHTKPVYAASTGINTSHSRESYQKSWRNVMQPSTRHSGGYHFAETGAKMTPNSRSRAQLSSPDPASVLNSHCTRFSKSPVSIPLANPCSPNAGIGNSNSVLSSSVVMEQQIHPKVPEVCAFDLSVVDENVSSPISEHLDTNVCYADNDRPKSQPTSLSAFLSSTSSTSILSYSLSDESGSGDPSSETIIELAGGCTEDLLGPNSSVPVMIQKCTSENTAEVEDQADLPCTSLCPLTQPVNDLNISCMAVTSRSGGINVVSIETDETVRSGHTGDITGDSCESLTVIEDCRLNVECAEDRLSSSELPSGLNSASDTETSNRSYYNESQLESSTSHTQLPLPVTVEVADISLDFDASNVVRNDSSDLVVTLSSSLKSALVEMFGPPRECDTAYGMPFMLICLKYFVV